ncbi:MAG: hydantoinase/oxoprolinase family protein, partial [Chloroflexi bacterium]|nr:hydantoinase/oxoprolinase family protein [Chloroflexota bacterium]
GIVEIANAAMVRAIRIVSVQRGYDPREFALVAFGGAGPLHALALAEEMGVPRVVVQPRPGLASALGLLVTDLKHDYATTWIEATARVDPERLERLFAELEHQGRTMLQREGVASAQASFGRRLEMRYLGQSYQLTIPVPGPFGPTELADAVERFHAAHEAAYGYAEPAEPTEVVNVRVSAVGRIDKPRLGPAGVQRRAGQPDGRQEPRPVFFRSLGFVTTDILDRRLLAPEQAFDGPAVVEEHDSTTLVQPGWRGRVDPVGNLLIERMG